MESEYEFAYFTCQYCRTTYCGVIDLMKELHDTLGEQYQAFEYKVQAISIHVHCKVQKAVARVC